MCETYRFTGHHVSDKQEYKRSEEMEAWQARDPIPSFGRWLVGQGHVDQDWLDQVDKEIDAEVAKAAELADAMTDPTPEDLSTHVYAS